MPPVFRYTLSRFFCFMQEKRFFYFPLRREWADRVVRPYIHSRLCGAKSPCREQKSTAAFFI